MSKVSAPSSPLYTSGGFAFQFELCEPLWRPARFLSRIFVPADDRVSTVLCEIACTNSRDSRSIPFIFILRVYRVFRERWNEHCLIWKCGCNLADGERCFSFCLFLCSILSFVVLFFNLRVRCTDAKSITLCGNCAWVWDRFVRKWKNFLLSTLPLISAFVNHTASVALMQYQ